MEDSRYLKSGDSSVIELTGKIMVGIIIILIFVVLFVFFIHLYIKWFWYRRRENASTDSNRRRLDFAYARQEMAAAAVLRKGLDPSVLNTIPISVYDAKQFENGLECAVCLCEMNNGEKTRLLPKCSHGFHKECIDLWFQSNSTCPICRNPVSNSTDSTLETRLQIPADESSNGGGLPTETPNLPTNVLFWGDDTQVSTTGTSTEDDLQNCSTDESSSSSMASSSSTKPDGILVIDIPRPINEEEDQKSPIPKRFRSLKRLLSGKRPL